jgi:NAD(P)-dependent dehydrogenase (short-subunit alcohol dehydrogenase family)
MTSPLIVIFGATGTTGSGVVSQLVDCGRRVRAVVRDRAKAEKFGGDVEIVQADLAEPDALAAAQEIEFPELAATPLGKAHFAATLANHRKPVRATGHLSLRHGLLPCVRVRHTDLLASQMGRYREDVCYCGSCVISCRSRSGRACPSYLA